MTESNNDELSSNNRFYSLDRRRKIGDNQRRSKIVTDSILRIAIEKSVINHERPKIIIVETRSNL